MRRKRFKTEEIIQKLREAEVLLSQGRNVSEACRQIGVTDNTYHPGNSERHPLNSADGSAVRYTKRYTLTRRVATATTQITIRGILRHGKSKTVIVRLHPLHGTPKPCRLHRHPDHHSRSLLAQFGLTPKYRRGLAASEAVEAHQAAACVVTDWRRINRLRLRCFRFRKCKNRLHLTVG